MKKLANQQLAQKIATDLLVCCDGRQATRVALKREVKGTLYENDHGGLCKGAVIQRIRHVLERHVK